MKIQRLLLRGFLVIGVCFGLCAGLFIYYPTAHAQVQGSAIADAAERTVDSVANISSTRVVKFRQTPLSPFFSDPFFQKFFGYREIPRERRERSLGSGVIVSADGILLTNNHVVEKASEILVTLTDGREFEAEIVGTDPKSDVAVIRLKGKPKNLKPVPLGDSGKLRLGEVVLAIGNPFGLAHTVTMGIVSAKGRADVGIADYEDFIQTDAAINPGNSGGALINLKGELVGINTAIASRTGGYQGIGFAIPSNMARAVMDSLLAHGRVVRGWLGVSIQDVTKEIAKALKLPRTTGVLISDVHEGSPADKAGLDRGDVILEINKEHIESVGKLRNIIATSGSGKVIDMKILREDKERIFRVTLGELPGSSAQGEMIGKGEGVLSGLAVAPVSPAAKEEFNLPQNLDYGVVVTDVQEGSSAGYAGLAPGDVILEVSRTKVKSVGEFRQLYKKSRRNLLLLILRKGGTFFLVLEK